MLKRSWLVGVAAATMACAGGVQAQTAAPGPDDAYELGELTVTARNRQGEMVGGETILSEDLRRRARRDRSQDCAACLNVRPGSPSTPQARCPEK